MKRERFKVYKHTFRKDYKDMYAKSLDNRTEYLMVDTKSKVARVITNASYNDLAKCNEWKDWGHIDWDANHPIGKRVDVSELSDAVKCAFEQVKRDYIRYENLGNGNNTNKN